jgi:hypothetical protein
VQNENDDDEKVDNKVENREDKGEAKEGRG